MSQQVMTQAPRLGVTGLRNRWFRLRDRLLVSERFQQFASRFPLFRPVARRRVDDLFALCSGFVHTQVLLACVRMDLFQLVRHGPVYLDELVKKTGADTEGLRTLVEAAAGIRLLRIEAISQDKIAVGLGDLGGALLGNPSVLDMIGHHHHLYEDLRDPVAFFSRPREELDTTLSAYWPYAKAGEPAELSVDAVSAYTELMGASQAMIAAQVLAAYPIHKHRQLLDLGGGNGSFSTAVARQVPAIAIRMLDLPAVAKQATARIAGLGLSHRITPVGGDFFRDELPAGADLISLVRILHDHDDARVLTLLKAARRAIAPAGVLLIAEPMSTPDQPHQIADSYFGVYLRAMGSGRPRSATDVDRLLAAAGFGPSRSHHTDLPQLVQVLTCKPV